MKERCAEGRCADVTQERDRYELPSVHSPMDGSRHWNPMRLPPRLRTRPVPSHQSPKPFPGSDLGPCGRSSCLGAESVEKSFLAVSSQRGGSPGQSEPRVW